MLSCRKTIAIYRKKRNKSPRENVGRGPGGWGSYTTAHKVANRRRFPKRRNLASKKKKRIQRKKKRGRRGAKSSSNSLRKKGREGLEKNGTAWMKRKKKNRTSGNRDKRVGGKKTGACYQGDEEGRGSLLEEEGN